MMSTLVILHPEILATAMTIHLVIIGDLRHHLETTVTIVTILPRLVLGTMMTTVRGRRRLHRLDHTIHLILPTHLELMSPTDLFAMRIGQAERLRRPKDILRIRLLRCLVPVLRLVFRLLVHVTTTKDLLGKYINMLKSPYTKVFLRDYPPAEYRGRPTTPPLPPPSTSRYGDYPPPRTGGSDQGSARYR